MGGMWQDSWSDVQYWRPHESQTQSTNIWKKSMLHAYLVVQVGCRVR